MADTIELRSGGHVSGQVRRFEEKKIDIVDVDDDIRIAFPTSRVRRVVSSDKLSEYRQKAAEAGEDAEEHYQLAIWCLRNISDSPETYKRFHMQMAIRFDPEHSNARASLDYVKENNRWIRYSDLQRSRGMISVARKWMLPEAAAIEKLKDSTNIDAKQWIREIDRLLRMVLRKNTKSAEAFEALKAIEDPLAAAAIGDQLIKGNHDRGLKLLWIELLGRFQTTTAVKALVHAGLQENDDVVREAALEQLQNFGSASAVASYARMLRSNRKSDVTRALRSLSFFPDIELAPLYINALVTKHSLTRQVGGGTSAGFGDTGGGGFSAGSTTQTFTDYQENPGALTLLKMVEPGADFGYDKQAWREYFAAKRGSYSGDLRRDP
ncbi:HEAT repeat domain-containing protein [Novipirellula artificiosorum]|nr:HEAT repeat domain-containing protein [Novipirellula artificiosorum]